VNNEPEELIGVRALDKWGGNGAVRVLVRDGNATVLERAGQTLRSLVRDDARPLKSRATRLSVSTPYRVENCIYRR
jgi:streptomycin 6-kinase